MYQPLVSRRTCLHCGHCAIVVHTVLRPLLHVDHDVLARPGRLHPIADMSTEFSLDRFESLVDARDYDNAHEALIVLINTLMSNRSKLPGVALAYADPTKQTDASGIDTLQRIADTITKLLADPDFVLSPKQAGQLLQSRHCLNMLFVASSY